MNFLENIIVSKITHISVVSFDKKETSRMEVRPWYGIACSLGGKLSYYHNLREIKLENNQIIFIPKNSTYHTVCRQAGSFALINFLTADDLETDEFIEIKSQNTELFQSEFSAMQVLFMSKSVVNEYSNFSHLYKILSMLTGDSVRNAIPPVLHNAVSYMERNIHSPKLSNTQIAGHVGISEVYLRKLFKTHLSVSVNQYIQRLRIEKAKKLLSETSESITEISEECGFSCIYYFCRYFKSNTGSTPTKYRTENFLKLF